MAEETEYDQEQQLNAPFRAFISFVGLCLKQAIRHNRAIWEVSSIWLAFLLAILGSVFRHFAVTNMEEILNALAWQIPIGLLALVTVVRLILSPYWVYKEALAKATAAESKLNEVEKEKATVVGALHSAQERNEELMHKAVTGTIVPDPHEWPPLTDSQIEQWINELRPFNLKTITVVHGPSVQLIKFYRSIQAIGKALTIAVDLSPNVPTKDTEFRIMATRDDPAAPKLEALCATYHTPIEMYYANFPAASMGRFSIFIGEKPLAGPLSNSLKVEFLDAPDVDPTIRVRVFRIRVTNTSHNKTAAKVKVQLDSFSISAWNTASPISLPHQLPVTSQYKQDQVIIYECDIDPRCSKTFDLAYSRLNVGVRHLLGICPIHIGRTHIWESTTAEVSPTSIPMDQETEISFSITASGLDLPKVPQSGTIVFPSFMNIGTPPYLKSLSSVPDRSASQP